MVCIKVPATLCARCKGRKRLCGAPTCPFIQRFYANIKALVRVKGLNVDGATPPTLIVGERGYPHVPVFLGVPPGVYGEGAKVFDDPKGWWGRLSLDEIVELRSSMVSGFIRIDVDKGPDALRDNEVLFAALSMKPVDSEIVLAKHPIPKLSFSDKAKPIPPSAPMKSVRISSNASMHPKVERVIDDDLPAQKAIVELYRYGVDIYTVQRALSLGALGRRKRRKLVPTRWAITAVDRTISRYLLSTLWGKDATFNHSLAFYAEYLGNRFWIFIDSGKYEIHWVEVWHPSTIYTQHASSIITVYNKERISGSIEYLDGGFEAAKLPVLEFLSREGKQGKVIIIREILPDYYAPVGNWHIRESIKRALSMGPVAKGLSLREFIDFVRSRSPIAASIAEEYVTRLIKTKLLDFFMMK